MLHCFCFFCLLHSLILHMRKNWAKKKEISTMKKQLHDVLGYSIYTSNKNHFYPPSLKAFRTEYVEMCWRGALNAYTTIVCMPNKRDRYYDSTSKNQVTVYKCILRSQYVPLRLWCEMNWVAAVVTAIVVVSYKKKAHTQNVRQ